MKYNVFMWLCLPLLFLATNMAAQIYQQRGVVRMITTSSSSPATPVAGVKVAVGNSLSKATGKDGVFTMQVPSEFQVNGIVGDEYVLALPTKGKTYYKSKNDLDVVVTTKAQKDEDYKKIYTQLKKKYRQQTAEINRMREELSDKLDEMQESDAEFTRVKAQRDSLQNLYREYVTNTEKIDEDIKKIAENLAITDFQSLSETEQQIYNLKCQGEYEAINKLLQRLVWHGDRSSAFKKQGDLIAQKEKDLEEERQKRETMLRLLVNDIESFHLQLQNDSVSYCYRILTDAAPDNWEYLNAAGQFEDEFMANYDKAVEYLQRAIALNPADTLQAKSYNNLGTVYTTLSEYEKAQECLEKALTIMLRYFGESHYYVGNCYNSMGVMYHKQEDYQKAKEYYEKALSITIATYGEDDPHTAISYGNVGCLYNHMHDYDKALELHQKALRIYKSAFSGNNPLVANTYNDIASVYQEQHDYDKAIDLYKQSLQIYQKFYGNTHSTIAMCYNNIATAYLERGDIEISLDFFEKSLNLYLTVFGENNCDVAMCYVNTAGAYNKQNNHQKALEYYEKATAIYERILPEDHPYIKMVKFLVMFTQIKIETPELGK